MTKGVSENARTRLGKAADVIIHPIAAVAQGQTLAKGGDGDESERQDFTTSGKRTEGFADAMIPTLEEKTIFERRPEATHANGAPLFDLIEEGSANGDEMPEAEVPGNAKKNDYLPNDKGEQQKGGPPVMNGDPNDKELFGAPANAHDDDDAPPTKHTDRGEPDSQEKLAIAARKTLRKHLDANVGTSPWNLPTPTPKINPNMFHDPLDERFWKDMWVAVAVHNTEIFRKVFRAIVSCISGVCS